MALYGKYVKHVTFCGSKNERIRYLLDVEFVKGDKDKIGLVIMQNPSKADEKESDTTISAVLNRLHKFKYSRAYLANLIPFYGTHSETIKELAVDTGLNFAYTKNSKTISSMLNRVSKIFVAWGDNNSFDRVFYRSQINNIREILKGQKVYCSGLTRAFLKSKK